MKTKLDNNTLQITGPPRRLRLVNVLCSPTPNVRLVSNESMGCFDKNQELPCRIRKYAKDRPLDLRIKLPEDTPPGHYRAQLEVGEEKRDVAINVDEHVKLKHTPTQLHFVGKPGEKVTQLIRFENRGNVTTSIAKKGEGNLYLNTGIPEAISNTLQIEGNDSNLLLSNLLLKLRDGYGGLIRMKFLADDYDLAAGESRTFTLEARLPKTLLVGNTYFGLLHLMDFHFLMSVTAK